MSDDAVKGDQSPSQCNLSSHEKRDRVAIVVIHGMGEPTPMDTIREFVTAVWETNPEVEPANNKEEKRTYTVPDWRAGTHEILRIKTGSAPRTRRTGDSIARFASIKADFFELYWADLAQGNTWSELIDWFKTLMVRGPHQVPRQVKTIWTTLWGFLVAALLVSLIPVVAFFDPRPQTIDDLTVFAIGSVLSYIATATLARRMRPDGLSWPFNLAKRLLAAFAIVATSMVIAEYVRRAASYSPFLRCALIIFTVTFFGGVILLKRFLTTYFGDVARYTTALPGNIQARRDIRERGLALLRNLSQSTKYERIVVVGHSLGCVVAYDLVCLLWADYATRSKVPIPANSKLDGHIKTLEKKIADAAHSDNFVGEVRDLQRQIYDQLSRLNPPTPIGPAATPPNLSQWRISDLVTIANALTHSEFLLARDQAAFAKRVERRELATCPPSLENDRLTYVDGVRTHLRHDVPFTSVRWSSIHDMPSHVLCGDFISGRVGHLFGARDTAAPHSVYSGILEIDVKPRRIGGSLPARLFTHNHYWSLPPDNTTTVNNSVVAIRHVVNVLDTDEAERGARVMAAVTSRRTREA